MKRAGKTLNFPWLLIHRLVEKEPYRWEKILANVTISLMANPACTILMPHAW